MTQKEEAISVLELLPPDATMVDCVVELAFNKMIDSGLSDAVTGKHISTDELIKMVNSWR